MISFVQGNASWLQANHAPQVGAREAAGETENDGDADDSVRSAMKAAPAAQLPPYMGSRIDALA